MNNRRKYYLFLKNILSPYFAIKAFFQILFEDFDFKHFKDLLELNFEKFLSDSISSDFDESIIDIKNKKVYILGCGESINKVSSEEWAEIENNVSIGVNYFYCHDFKTDINLIEFGKSQEAINCLNLYLEYSSNITAIHARHKFFSKKDISILKNKNKFEYSPLVLRSTNNDFIKRILKSLFGKRLIHHCSNIDCAISLAVLLGAKEISLVGVDLNNSKYFWDEKNEPNFLERNIKIAIEKDYLEDNIKRKGVHATLNKEIMDKNTSLTIDEYLKLLNNLLNEMGVKLFISNKNSRLASILEYKSIL